MKLILRTLLISNILINALVAADTPQRIFDDVIVGIKQICLPDGLSLYGDATAVMGEHHFTACP